MARSVTKQVDIQLELVCVGKSISKERNNEFIENMYIYMLPELHNWIFWKRLKCMWNSRKKPGLSTMNDAIMQKIVSLNTYDNSDRPWAVFGRGQYGEMAMQEGELMYKVLEEFSEWRVNIDENNNFVKVLDEVLRDRRPENISRRSVDPGSTALQNEYSLAQKKSASNPTPSELLAPAFAKPNTVSPHDQMLSEPYARKHPIHLMSNVAPFTSHLARKEHHKFAVTEETAVVRSIQSYRAPDGVEYAYDSKYVFNIIEYTIIRVCAVIPVVKHQRIPVTDGRLDKLHGENLMKRHTLSNLRDELADPIHNISALLINHCDSDGDGRKVSEKICQSLAPFPFEAKVVIALAAFTMQYGEFWLLAERHRSHPFAGSVPFLMEIPEIMGNLEVFCPKFKAITDVVDAMLDVTRTIIELIFDKRNISHDAEDDISTSRQLSVIPTACYWVIKSIVACSAILLNLMAMGHEYLTSQVNWELRSLGHKLGKTKSLLDEQWRKYQHKLDERRQHDLYLALKRIFGTSHDDNLIGIKTLVNNIDDPYPLYDGTRAIKKQLEVLKRKSVMLLVSHLDIPALELAVLSQLYHESRMYAVRRIDSRIDSRIEIVWVPIFERTVSSHRDPELKARYHETQRKMPWYSVSAPFMVEPGAVKFIREQLKFNEKPILIVLDPQGRISNYDAIDMCWIWGFEAAPFDEARERELWRDARWSMDLLVNAIDPDVYIGLTNNKYVCVFGGDNIEWIKKFTTMARSVTEQLDIQLELLYVGKSTSKEFVKRNNEFIERMCNVLPESDTWFFWERLKRMWNSMERRGLSTLNDAIMQKILSVLIYDNSDRPWAVFGRGQFGEMAMQEGELMYKVLEEFPEWRVNIDLNNNFVKVLDDVLKDHRPENICWRLLYPGSSTRAPPKIEWPECKKPMGKQLVYSCCSD